MRALAVFTAAGLAVLAGPIVATAEPKPKPPRQVQIVNDPLAVITAPPPRFQLVGFTNATFAGDAGVLGMSRGCAVELPGSRMCDSLEVLETSAVPDLTGRPRAWVRPSPVPGGTPGRVVDASGAQEEPNNLTCIAWSFATSGNSGLTVSTDGSFFAEASAERGRCDVPRPVACCALIP